MPAPAAALPPGWILDRLLYRDALALVIDKPAGLPVHAGPKGGSNLEDHLDALRFGLPRRPGLAHRLDRDTSGCLVLGRHRQALARLGRLFAAGRVEKVYWAVVAGSPPAEEGRVEAPLRKLNEQRGWWMEAHPEGQAAVTDYRVLGRAGGGERGLTWLECRPRTGRTHQIRVHCAGLGCPVLGDPVYGPREPSLPPLHLHARFIGLPLYPGKPPVVAEAPPPEHMLMALAACGWVGRAAGAPSPAAPAQEE